MRRGPESVERLKGNIVDARRAGLRNTEDHAPGIDRDATREVSGRIPDRGRAEGVADHVHLVLPLSHRHREGRWHAKVVRYLDGNDVRIGICPSRGKTIPCTNGDLIRASMQRKSSRHCETAA